MLRVLKERWGLAGLVLLVLLLVLGGEQVAQALKKKVFKATRDPGPGFIATATSGPPLQVNSTDLVANLNAELLNGLQASAFALAVHGHDVSQVSGAATLGANSFTGNQTVNGTVDATGFVGDGSGLTNIPSSQVSGPNPLQIALLRWYEANQSGASFAVGVSPRGVAFDGDHIWVTNGKLGLLEPGNVTKLRASDGFVLDTITVGSAPFGVAFDGAHIWVANNGSDTVTKL